MRRPGANDTVESLRHSLRELGLGTSGKKDTLLKRARKAYATLVEDEVLEAAAASSSASPTSSSPGAASGSTSLPARGHPGKYKAFLLFDAEGTCESGAKDYDYPNEIIEFPVVLLKWRRRPHPTGPICQELYIASSFQSYVRPTLQPKLSTFCTSLTGITQSMVDHSPEFPQVLADFERWLADNDLDRSGKGGDKDWLWVTDGPWDLRDFVTKQLYISRLKPSNYPYLSGPVLDLKTALHDRWQPELIRTTLEDVVTFPLTQSKPKMNPESSSGASSASVEGCGSELSGWESPPSPPSKPVAIPSSAPSSSPPLPPPVPLPLRSPSSSPTRLAAARKSPSPSHRSLPSGSPEQQTIPPVLDQSPLMRALGAERPPQRTMGRINKHMKTVRKSDGTAVGRYLTIHGMVKRLNMGEFEGPAHSGIVDAFNMARVVIHLSQLPPALRTQLLEPNMHVQQGSKKFSWMAGDGDINRGAFQRGSLSGAKAVARAGPATATFDPPTTVSNANDPPPSTSAPTSDGSLPADETAKPGSAARREPEGSLTSTLLGPLRRWISGSDT